MVFEQEFHFSDLIIIACHGKFQSSMEHAKLSIDILLGDLLHGITWPRPKALRSFMMNRQTMEPWQEPLAPINALKMVDPISHLNDDQKGMQCNKTRKGESTCRSRIQSDKLIPSQMSVGRFISDMYTMIPFLFSFLLLMCLITPVHINHGHEIMTAEWQAWMLNKN